MAESELLIKLFEEASRNFPYLIKAGRKDVDLILKFISRVDNSGDFFYEYNRLLYNLFDEEYVLNLVNSKKDLIAIMKEDSLIKAFSHWGLDKNNVCNYYTVVGEKGKGLGKKIYEAFLKPLNKNKINFTTEFVLTPVMAKVYETWEKHGTLPMGFLCSKYVDRKGNVFSSVVGGKVYGKENIEIAYVPKISEEYAEKLFDIHGINCDIETIDIKPKRMAEKPNEEMIINFNDRETIEKVIENGYAFAGIIPDNGMIFYSSDGSGIKNLENGISKSSSNNLTELFECFLKSNPG